MKAQPYREVKEGEKTLNYLKCKPEEATHLMIKLESCYEYRLLPVHGHFGKERQHEKSWEWNGDTERVTLMPSILAKGGEPVQVCHCWVSLGRSQFLDDCTHENRGKTVDLIDVEKWKE